MAGSVVDTQELEFYRLQRGFQEDFFNSSDKNLFLARMREIRPSLLGENKQKMDNQSFYVELHKEMKYQLGNDNGIVSPLDYQEWDWDIGEIPHCPIKAKDLKNPEIRSRFDDFILVLIPRHISGKDISIRSCFDLFAKDMYKKWGNQWYKGEDFAHETTDSHWVWIRKTPVSKSFSKTWFEQRELISEGEVVPTTRQQVFATLLYFKKSGERINEDVYVRTSTVDRVGDHVDVGYFGCGGLGINCDCDDRRHDSFGVASSISC